MSTTTTKITADHLARSAYLYVRQSSLHQVLENTESTERQYGLRRRAIALGWPEERIVVIDRDQGQSGASASDRAGFQRLVADVGLGKAGIVMGLEVSRLARNNADWHRLLEISAFSHTLILDEDGLYDPGHYNDRLLLGLKGTMSEAELHILKARLVGGVLNKARRGELKMPLPIGLIYDPCGRVELEPDTQVQETLRTFFTTFNRIGTAWGIVRDFRTRGLKFPVHGQAGSGNIAWQNLTHALALDTLHNPRYAGSFVFGRTRTWKDAEGRRHTKELSRDQWKFVKQDAHPGYITWEEFLTNEKRLQANRQSYGGGTGHGGPAREGPALLQGLVICAKCGRNMTVRYHWRGGQLTPDYLCQFESVQAAGKICQRIPGPAIDVAIGQRLVAHLTPFALEAALNVQVEIQNRLAEAARLRQQHVQRAQYEVEQAQLRYMRVDSNNRLVADALEANWNEKLLLLAQAKEECAAQQRADSLQLTAEQTERVRALASEFPQLWNNPKTADRDRKRMARLLIEDVTLRRDREITVQVRFKGGATDEIRLPLPKCAWELRRTKAEIVPEVDRLLDDHSEASVARELNERGWRSGGGHPFTARLVNNLRRAYGLKSCRQRALDRGWLTARGIADLLGCHIPRINHWRCTGLLIGAHFNGRRDYLYQKPTHAVLEKIRARQRRHCWKNPTNESYTRGAV